MFLGGAMWGRVVGAALCVASACGRALAQDPGTEPIVVFETSESVRYWATELAFFDDQPKAWDAIVSPEFSAALRATAGSFDARVEIGALSDRFVHFEDFDADSLRAMLQFGWRSGDWSAVLEWEGFDVFEPGIGDFYVGFNTYDLRVGKVFTAEVLKDRPEGLFLLSLTAGYAASTFDPLDKRFAELELEWVQPCGGGWAFAIAPKVELADYPRFSTEERRDATFSLRMAPTYNIAKGTTLTLEGQASFAFSSLATKTGETWAITPIFRFQTAL